MADTNGNRDEAADVELRDRSLLVLYGSETGKSQEIAESLGRLCERLRFDTAVEEMNDVKLVCV